MLMHPLMYPNTRDTINLRSGQSLCLHARTKMHFIVTRGQVSITEAPIWLGDQFLKQKSVLHDGDLCVVQRGGWMTIQACEAYGFAEMICFESRSKIGLEAGLRSLADRLPGYMPAFCRELGQRLAARLVGSVRKG